MKGGLWPCWLFLCVCTIQTTSNNRIIVKARYGCQSEQNQREEMIILIIIETSASNSTVMRACSRKNKKKRLSDRGNYRRDGHETMGAKKNNRDRSRLVMWSAAASFLTSPNPPLLLQCTYTLSAAAPHTHVDPHCRPKCSKNGNTQTSRTVCAFQTC